MHSSWCSLQPFSLMREKSGQLAISFPELRSPWPAVGKRELWEHPFQAWAIACQRCRLRLRSEPDNQNSFISYCYFKMDAPRALVFRPLVKGNEALRTRLGSWLKRICRTWLWRLRAWLKHLTFQVPWSQELSSKFSRGDRSCFAVHLVTNFSISLT